MWKVECAEAQDPQTRCRVNIQIGRAKNIVMSCRTKEQERKRPGRRASRVRPREMMHPNCFLMQFLFTSKDSPGPAVLAPGQSGGDRPISSHHPRNRPCKTQEFAPEATTTARQPSQPRRDSQTCSTLYLYAFAEPRPTGQYTGVRTREQPQKRVSLRSLDSDQVVGTPVDGWGKEGRARERRLKIWYVTVNA